MLWRLLALVAGLALAALEVMADGAAGRRVIVSLAMVAALLVRLVPGRSCVHGWASNGAGAIDDWLTGSRNRLLIRVFPHRGAGACRSHDGPQTDPVSPCRVRNRLLLSDAILDEIVDNHRIGKCRGIPQGIRFVGCDLAQDAAHDLAGARLR